ncbi:MAG: hypothetical protein J1F16_10600 [Muribaculaceae bacterium]|nr:hypothetical protein [Muribaculaceae bacterium]
MSHPLKKIPYSDPTALKLHVYVVGYPIEGESILFVISEDDKAILTIVTDCYEDDDNYNHVSSILSDEWNYASIDAFIWTHPHKDHSQGIITLLDKHDKERKAHIIATANVVGFQNYPKDIWKGAKNIQDYLLKYYPPESFQYHFKSYDPYEDCTSEFLLYGENPKCPPLNITLDFVAPVGSLVAKQMNNTHFKPNKGSLVFIFSINMINVFMGGDLDEIFVPLIREDIFSHINLIKIPHHGSEKTGNIHLKFGMNECENVHAVTTICKRSQDPKETILKGYLNNDVTIHCTGPNTSDAPKESYGCVHYIFDISMSRLETLHKSSNVYQFI